MAIVENHGYVIAPLVFAPVNKHDTLLVPESLTLFRAFADDLGLAIDRIKITFDAGFDGDTNKRLVRDINLIPVIHPNRRNTKGSIAIARMYRWFDRVTYEKRFCVERCFAWADVYRKIATCYERLTATRRGLRYLTYALINLRNSL